MKYKKNKDLVLQRLDGKLVGLDVERSYLYTFNETAEFIYRKVVLGWDEEKIVTALEKKYGIDSSVAKRDIKEIIKNFIKNKIILLDSPHS